MYELIFLEAGGARQVENGTNGWLQADGENSANTAETHRRQAQRSPEETIYKGGGGKGLLECSMRPKDNLDVNTGHLELCRLLENQSLPSPHLLQKATLF